MVIGSGFVELPMNLQIINITAKVKKAVLFITEIQTTYYNWIQCKINI